MQKNLSVLIVEDDGIQEIFLKNLLLNIGHEVCFSTAYGQEAIDACDRYTPSLVILDIMLKGKLNGINTAKTIWQNHKIPIIISTANMDPDIIRETHEIGPFGLLIKPFSEDELRECINQTFIKYQKHNEMDDHFERSTLLYKNSSIGYVEINCKGIITDVNPFVAEMLGKSQQDILKHKFIEFLHSDAKTGFARQFDQALQDNQPLIFDELRLAANQHNEIWVQFDSMVCTFPGIRDNVLRCTLINISRFKEMREEITQSNEKYRILSENISEGVALIENDRITYISPEYAKILGYHEDEVKNFDLEHIFTDIHPDDRDHIRNHIKEAHKKQLKHYTYSYRMRNAEGEYIWMEDSLSSEYDSKGIRTRTIVRAREITKQILQQSELKASEEKYRNLVELIQEGIWTIDENGYTNFVNERMAQMLGYRVDEMMGRHLFEFMDEHNIEICKQKLASRRQGMNEEHEFEFVSKTGKPIIVLMHTSPIIDKAQTYKGALATVIDITDQKRHQEVLIENEKKYQLLFDNAPTGIISINADGKILEVNQKMLDILGSPSAEATKQINFISFPPLKETGVVDLFLKCIETKKNQVGEHYYHSKWGKSRYLHYHFSPIINKDGTVDSAQANVIDYTERKNIEDQYHSLVNNLPVGVFRSTVDGKVISANPAMATMYGYDSVEEMLKRPADTYYSTQTPRQKMLDDLFKKGRLKNYVTCEKKKDGTEIWVSTNYSLIRGKDGEPELIDGVIEDITETRDLINKLTESEARYRTIVENIPVMIDELDQDGKCIYWNKECEKQFGYSAEEIKALESPLSLFYPDTKDHEKALSSVNKAEEMFTEFTVTVKDNKEKSQMWADFKLENGRVIGVGYDITDRKNQLHKLESLVKEKEILIAEIHHRVKNNLATMSALVDLQASKLKNSQDAIEAFHKTRDRIRSMANVHEQLYLTDSFEKLSMDYYISSLINALLISYGHKGLKSHIETNGINLNINQAIPVGLIINELITNAIKHAFPNKQDGKISVVLSQKEDRVYLDVQDNGVGYIQAGQAKDNLGRTLINLLVRQIDGTMKTYHDKGVKVRINFPIN